MISRILQLALLSFLATISFVGNAQSVPIAVEESGARLSFSADRFFFVIPVALPLQSGSVEIVAELLDPSGAARSRGQGTCDVASTVRFCRVELPPASTDPHHPDQEENDLSLFRVRYSVAMAGAPAAAGILALAHIAPDLFELHIVAPKDIRPGQDYVARLRAIHPLTHRPIANLALTASLSASYVEDDKADEELTHTRLATDADGFASIPFHVPDLPNLASLNLDVEGMLTNLHLGITQTLTVPEHASLSLTTDKPLYQPGQTLHSRLLLLDRNGKAWPGTSVTVDISDPDSTLVYRQEVTTSSFGIATVDWQVPARLRLGDYEVQASVAPDSDVHLSARRTVRLSRYDLPTFIVAPKPDKPFYLQGTDAVVEVRGNYLFGKPVQHGHVRVVREDDRTWNFAKQQWDVKAGPAISGELDAHGVFKAHVPLAKDLKQYRNQEASNEFEDLHFAAYFTDASTGRTEERRFDLRIARQALHLYLTAGRTAKGLAQTFYVAATTADGLPAECDLTLSLLPHEGLHDSIAQRVARARVLEHLHTDSRGLARVQLPANDELVRLMPAASGPAEASAEERPELYLAGQDRKGQTGAIHQAIEAPTQLLEVTTRQNIYKPGDTLTIHIDSIEAALPITMQTLRQTRRGIVTLASQQLTLDHGHASITLPTDARYRGLVFVVATALGIPGNNSEQNTYYYSDRDRSTAVASKAILFPSDTSLHVDLRMSAKTYKPGEQATASLSVQGPQDPDGDEVASAPSAVGLVAVDQAVEERNRTDTDFGGDSRSFFFGERFYFDTAGSAGGFTFQSLNQLNPTQPIPPDAQLAAEILFARSEPAIGTASSAEERGPAEAFRILIDGQLLKARTAITKYLKTHAQLPTALPELSALLPSLEINVAELRDPWGMPYTLVAEPNSQGTLAVTLHSNGPDKLPGTGDDFSVQLGSCRWFTQHEQELQHAIIQFHQRTGRFVRTLPDLRDEMREEGIPFDAWRDPWGQPFVFRFSVQQTYFAVEASTAGDPAYKPRYDYMRGPYLLGGARIQYTAEIDSSLAAALDRFVQHHPFPKDAAQFQAALHTAAFPAARLVDPWHRPLYVTFRSHSIFTDRVRTEAHAMPGAAPQVRTTATPVTAVEDIVELHSLGLDGKRNTPDDFLFVSFAHMRSLQSARDSSPQRLAHFRVNSGPAGSITGTVVDPTGAVIAGATIVAKNAKTGNSFEEKTDRDGRYLLGPLPVGTYTLRIDLPGFVSFVYDQVILAAGTTLTLDATLNVGAASQTVEVNASPVTLETQNASVAVTVDKQEIHSLPVSSTQFDRLAGFARGVAAPPPSPTPRLRNYFPETLLWRPEIITAADGSATATFPVADNITAWTISAQASTRLGNLGEATASFSTFQPFFAAFDPPSILTVGDTIALPVTLRNYLDHAVSVQASLAPKPWSRLAGPPSQTVDVASQQSSSPVFRFTALTPVTNAAQEFLAQSPDGGDRVERPVIVHPNGEDSAVTASGILLPGDNTFTLTLPDDTLPGTAETTLRIYPNLAAHLRDALIAMARYPGGCGEQIISTAWPSLLLERYAAALPQKDKKPQHQTHRFLEQAYENLLANRLTSGGFAYWPKDKQPDLALTAYAVQFLSAASLYVAVDPTVISAAVTYLAHQQQKDGGWIRVDRDQKAHPEDKRANTMLTASIAAMLAGAPGAQPLLEKALFALQPAVDEIDEPYTLASYTLAAAALKDNARTDAGVKRLRALALPERDGSYWALETNTPFFGWGRPGRVEATAQVLHALLAAGAAPNDNLVARGMLFLNRQQDRYSLWYSTQATARVLDVLSAIALRQPASGQASGQLSLAVDHGQTIAVPLPPVTADAGPILQSLAAPLGPGTHSVTVHLPAGASSATAQFVTDYYRPWPSFQPPALAINNEQLRMTVAFSTTHPRPGQAVTATAHVERIGFRGYGMLIAEVGLPPGVDVDRASLESALAASGYQLNHYDVLPDRVLFYLWPRAGGLDLKFKFTLRYAVDALTAPSLVYDNYNPDSRLALVPQRFLMAAK